VRILFLYLRGTSGIYYLFGEESGADELIEAVGGIDVAGEIGWQGLRPMTDEALVAANPDLILVMTGGLESVGGVDALITEKPAIGLTRAGENRRFVDMADGEVLSFGPRTPDVLDALARAIYAPAGVNRSSHRRSRRRARTTTKPATATTAARTIAAMTSGPSGADAEARASIIPVAHDAPTDRESARSSSGSPAG